MLIINEESSSKIKDHGLQEIPLIREAVLYVIETRKPRNNFEETILTPKNQTKVSSRN